MSDTRAAIRELRSLSEKRGAHGLNEAERERLATLRQQLGLPPEPGLSGAPASSVAGTGMDAGSAGPAQGAAGTPQTTTLQLVGPAASDTDRFATIGSERPASPSAATEVGASLSSTEAPEVPSPPAPANDLAWAGQQGAEPLPLTTEVPEAPDLPPAEVAGFDAPATNDLAWAGQQSTEPLQLTSEVPEAAVLTPAELAGFDAPATNDLAWAGQQGTEPLQLTSEVPEAPVLTPAELAGFDAAVTKDLAWASQDGAEPLQLTSDAASPSDPGPTGPSLVGFETGGDAANWGAQPVPPDAPLSGEVPDSNVRAVAAAEDGGPALVLSPEDLGAVPLDSEPFAFAPARQAEESLAPPLDDATRRNPIDGSFNPARLGFDEPIVPLSESGPIELSAADVMLLGEADVRTDPLAGLDVGGDASEPVPLAEAHDFVQYQREDGPAVSLEESGAGEFLQASSAELAASAEAYVRPPAAPGIRVPPPPTTSAPLPRTATSPSIPAPRPIPSWQRPPLSAAPAASAPATRPSPMTPLPGAIAPPPPPPSLRPAPQPVPSPPTSAGFPPPPPLPLPRPPPASLMHPPSDGPPPSPATGGNGAVRSGAAQPLAPLRALTPPFPQLTPAMPDLPERPAPQSGPFAPPTLQPAARLDVMDGFEEQGLPGASPLASLTPPPTATAAPPPTSGQEPMFGSSFLSPTFVEGEHRVVLHTLEGQVKRGTVCDVDLQDANIPLTQPGQLPDRIAAERLKAIFFMQAPGEPPLPQSGRKVRVHFRDGRHLLGFSEDVESNETGFFLVPADTRTHTARIYVFRAGVQSIADG